MFTYHNALRIYDRCVSYVGGSEYWNMVYTNFLKRKGIEGGVVVRNTGLNKLILLTSIQLLLQKGDTADVSSRNWYTMLELYNEHDRS